MGRRGGEGQRGLELPHGMVRWQNRCSHIHMWWIKMRRVTSGGKDLSPNPDHTAQGSSARKKNPHNSGCKNEWGLGQQNKLPDLQKTPFKKNTRTQNLPRPTPSGIQHQGNSQKDTSHIRRVSKVSGNRVSAGQNSRSQAMALFPFPALPHAYHKVVKQVAPHPR